MENPVLRSNFRQTRSGVALILVLCFVVLLTISVLTLLSLSKSNGLISNASANFSKTDIYGHGAIQQILGDLRQEINAGSTATSVYTSPSGVVTYVYRPSQSNMAGAAPALSGPGNYGQPGQADSVWNFTFPNLIKESIYGGPFYNPQIGGNSPDRAAPMSTSPDSSRYSQNGVASGISLNGRSITISRWNKHLLLPNQAVTITGGHGLPVTISDSRNTEADVKDTTPHSEFLAPDWILTASDGSNPKTFSTALTNPSQTSDVVGRYAFAIYNEGGLLDANAAGTPTAGGPSYPPGNLSSAQRILWGRKGSEAFADLTVLPGIAKVSTVTPQQVADAIAGWRNSATAQSSVTTFPTYTFGTLDSYFNGILGISNRFMTAASYLNATDNKFTSRQQLIQFMNDIANGNPSDEAYLQDAMMYLTHFSRTLNQPSYYPDTKRPTILGLSSSTVWNQQQNQQNLTFLGNFAFGQDNNYNPAFKSIRVGTSFTRNDGSLAVVGEPLVKKRFPLSRLVWITYKGPSANNMGDAAIEQSITALGGNPANTNDPVTEFVAQGTDANIRAYFGLVWTAGLGSGGIGGYWTYGVLHHAAPRVGLLPLEIAPLQQVAAANREPDFFELLQAAICCGSLGTSDSTGSGANTGGIAGSWQKEKDAQVSLQVLQIGANMIDQVSPVSFPTHIVFNNKTNKINPAFAFTYSIWGSTDLPYLSNVGNIAFPVVAAAPAAPVPPGTNSLQDQLTVNGVGVALAIPTIWNPYAVSATAVSSPASLRISISDVALDSQSASSTDSSHVLTVSSRDWDNNLATTSVPEAFDDDSTPNHVGVVDPTTGMAMSPELDTTKPLANNNILFFNNSTTLYREPFPLMVTPKQNPTNQPGNNPAGIYIDLNNEINLATPSGNNWTLGIPELSPSGYNFLGFLLGTYFLRFHDTTSGNTYTTASFSPAHPSLGQTISLEYLSGSAWIPYRQYDFISGYDQIAAPYTTGGSTTTPNSNFYNQPIIVNWPVAAGGPQLPMIVPKPNQPNINSFPWYTTMYCDPRTDRFGTYKDEHFQPFQPSTPVTPSSLYTYRPGSGAGVLNTPFQDDPGSVTQNLTVNGPFTYKADPDGIVRRAMGGYGINFNSTPPVPLSNPLTGLPMATQNYPSRPIILHRPFRSVAELGYVFSDTPWKNLDFFTPESGDAALLDTFCVNEDYRPDAVSAGHVDLNGRQTPVFAALLAGAYRDEWESVAAPPANISVAKDLTSAEATNLAQALVARTIGDVKPPSTGGPLYNIADLVGRYTGAGTPNPNANGQPYDGFSADVGSCYVSSASVGTDSTIGVQRFRETAIRALTDAGQAGTWNLLIDVIAQSGRYPGSAQSLSDFLVEGERHYWVHVAIDRTTGDIIDENIEVVNE